MTPTAPYAVLVDGSTEPLQNCPCCKEMGFARFAHLHICKADGEDVIKARGAHILSLAQQRDAATARADAAELESAGRHTANLALCEGLKRAESEAASLRVELAEARQLCDMTDSENENGPFAVYITRSAWQDLLDSANARADALNESGRALLARAETAERGESQQAARAEAALAEVERLRAHANGSSLADARALLVRVSTGLATDSEVDAWLAANPEVKP